MTSAVGRDSGDPSVVGLALLLGGLFGLGGLGSTALAVVLPQISASLSIPVTQSSWLISLYVLSFAISTPVYGRLVDIVGVRIPLLAGVVLITIGAVLSATADGFYPMAAARLLQGLGTGVGFTLSVAVISTRFEDRERTRGLAIAAGTAASIGAFGPLLGGLVESVATWRGVAALPSFALVILVLLWRRVGGPGVGSTFDVLGAVLVALAAGGVIMLLQSPSSGATVALSGAILMGVGAPLAVRRSRRDPDAFLPAEVLLNRRILVVCLIAGTVPASWFALLVAIPTKLGEREWSPMMVGLALLPGALVAAFAPRFTPAVGRWFGSIGSLRIASVLSCVSVLVAAVSAQTGFVVGMVGSVAVVSIAFGVGQPALFAVVGDLAALEVRGTAVGFATLVFLVCGSAGSAIVGGLSAVTGMVGGLLVLALVCAGGVLLALAGPRREMRPWPD